MRTVEITKEPVELFKILKFEGLVASGGEAKMVIAGGFVLVNGEVETRKRKKIVSGDIIEFADHIIQILYRKSSA
jgi:ribosome-associated protein